VRAANNCPVLASHLHYNLPSYINEKKIALCFFDKNFITFFGRQNEKKKRLQIITIMEF
jgi:hypothetical protein